MDARSGPKMLRTLARKADAKVKSLIWNGSGSGFFIEDAELPGIGTMIGFEYILVYSDKCGELEVI